MLQVTTTTCRRRHSKLVWTVALPQRRHPPAAAPCAQTTTRKSGRFQYGMIETSIKAPKGYGPWPAAWLNGCYGFIAESSGEFLLQEDYPFLCGQYWSGGVR